MPRNDLYFCGRSTIVVHQCTDLDLRERSYCTVRCHRLCYLRHVLKPGRWTIDVGRFLLQSKIKTLQPAHYRSCILFPFIVFRCMLLLIITINIAILGNGIFRIFGIFRKIRKRMDFS